MLPPEQGFPSLPRRSPPLRSGGRSPRAAKQLIEQLEGQMKKAAQMLEYEIAAQLRDEIIRLKGEK